MKYFLMELNSMHRSSCLNNSHCTADLTVPMNNSTPLRILIRRMLDKAFGKPNRMIDFSEDRCNFENENCEVDSSMISLKNENIISHDLTNGCSLLHESLSNCTNHKNSKLITIEEESINSSHYSDGIQCTGIYLNELLKSNNKPIDHIKYNDSLSPQNDTEMCSSRVDTDNSINNSLCSTNLVSDESSICQQNDNNDQSVIIIDATQPFNGIDVSSNDENTAEFLHISKMGNDPKTKQVSCETESLVDASLIHDDSVKSRPVFISTLTLKRRTPKSSTNKNRKLFKTPCFNVNLTKSQTRYRSSFHIPTSHTLTTPKAVKKSKVSKDCPQRAKSCTSHGISKPMVAPQIMLTPATPKLIF